MMKLITEPITKHTQADHWWYLEFWGLGCQDVGKALGLKRIKRAANYHLWFKDEALRVAAVRACQKVSDTGRTVVEWIPQDENRGYIQVPMLQPVVYAHLHPPQGVDIVVRYDFFPGYREHSIHYMWEEGNMSCDCNRFLNMERTCPGGLCAEMLAKCEDGHFPCGDTIELVKLDIAYERPEPYANFVVTGHD